MGILGRGSILQYRAPNGERETRELQGLPQCSYLVPGFVKPYSCTVLDMWWYLATYAVLEVNDRNLYTFTWSTSTNLQVLHLDLLEVQALTSRLLPLSPACQEHFFRICSHMATVSTVSMTAGVHAVVCQLTGGKMWWTPHLRGAHGALFMW